MKKLGLILLAVAFLASFAVAKDKASKSTKIHGWVSDAKCGVKGANAAHAACAKKCADAGEKLVIVSDKDQKIYSVDNQDALKGHEGHHVSVTGAVKGDSIHVDKVDMMKEPTTEKKSGEYGKSL